MHRKSEFFRKSRFPEFFEVGLVAEAVFEEATLDDCFVFDFFSEETSE